MTFFAICITFSCPYIQCIYKIRCKISHALYQHHAIHKHRITVSHTTRDVATISDSEVTSLIFRNFEGLFPSSVIKKKPSYMALWLNSCSYDPQTIYIRVRVRKACFQNILWSQNLHSSDAGVDVSYGFYRIMFLSHWLWPYQLISHWPQHTQWTLCSQYERDNLMLSFLIVGVIEIFQVLKWC